MSETREKAIIGVHQFTAFTKKAKELMDNRGYDHLNISMLGTDLRLTYLLFIHDRPIGRITMHDVYEEMYGNRKEVCIKIKDKNEQFTKDPNEQLINNYADQAIMRKIYQEAFNYAITILEGNQEKTFLKMAKPAVQKYNNSKINEISEYLVENGSSEPSKINPEIDGINLDTILKAVDKFIDPKDPSNNQTRKILTDLYEVCIHIDPRTRKQKIIDTIIINFKKRIHKKPQQVQYQVKFKASS